MRVGVSKAGRTGVALVALLAGLGSTGTADATTLTDALLAAYKDNPTLTGQRAQLNATDEGVAIARAQGRPTVGGSANYTQGINNGFRDISSFNRQLSAGATLSVPLFAGGRVRNAIKAADRRVDQGRADLRATEGDVFVQTVGAYMDVLRDRRIVELNINNVKVLTTNLEATKDQFQAGSLTRTDVAQSQARLELGHAQLASARATLVGSEENYRRVIGLAADLLDQPPALPVLPDTPERAEATAIDNNPDIASASAAVKAARYDVSTARAQALPTLSGNVGNTYYDYHDAVVGGAFKSNAASGGVTLTVPLYQGGAVAANVRQQQALEQQAMEQQTAVERQVVANARAYFSSYQASQDTIRSSEEAVKANTLALEGVRAEQSVGERQVLDVLNAEQELLNSQVTLVSSQHDAYVAAFALLNAMGLVNYQRLGLEGGALYDPTIHYKRSVSALSDFADDPRPQPIARPTYGPQLPGENPPVTPPAN